MSYNNIAQASDIPISDAALAMQTQVPAFRLPPLDKLFARGIDVESSSLVSLAKFKGKVVYIDFWASWCLPCLKSFPALSQIHKEYHHSGFEIIAINMDDNPENARAFLAEYPVSYPVLHGQNTNIAKEYRIYGLPTAFLVDASGNLRLIHTGFKESDVPFLEANIKKLLAEKAILE